MFRSAFSVIAFALLIAPVSAQAASATEKYQPISLQLITSYVVQSGLTAIKSDEQFLEYMRLSECDIYTMIKPSPFRQRELRTALDAKLKGTNAMNSKPLYVYKDTAISVAEYNFDTQAIDIKNNSKMQNVGYISLISERGNKICGETPFNLKDPLPTTYTLKLVFPISMIRIPMQKDFAEAVMTRLDASARDKSGVVYVRLYFQIEPITPPETSGKAIKYDEAILYGQLDMVDLFMDYGRKTLIKRLNYAENY